jgi:hypothetical protein
MAWACGGAIWAMTGHTLSLSRGPCAMVSKRDVGKGEDAPRAWAMMEGDGAAAGGLRPLWRGHGKAHVDAHNRIM